MVGFEPTASGPPDRCASRLRHIPVPWLLRGGTRTRISPIGGAFASYTTPSRPRTPATDPLRPEDQVGQHDREIKREPEVGIEPTTFSLPWRHSSN